jgi:pimeloyl-ACP methyl ester carboxylesterase
MATPSEKYHALDVPEVLTRLFYPRPELAALGPPTSAEEVLMPVASGVMIGARCYAAGPANPTLLFFHGNGEIVADYEELGPLYVQRGLNFFPVDYRGYGRSSGTPTVTAMMSDCHAILDFVQEWLRKRNFTGPLAVMGRSLGSASALELAAFHPDRLDGLIIESGFAYAGPLLQLLGVDLQGLGFNEAIGFRNVDKIRQWTKPLLVIHAEQDQIIPVAEGLELYDACPSQEKTLLKVAGAGHNDILSVGFPAYMEAVSRLGSLLSRR